MDEARHSWLGRGATAVAAVLAGAAVLSGAVRGTDRSAPAPRSAPADASHVRVPASFEPNVGQADPRAAFVGRVPGGTVALGPDRFSFTVSTAGHLESTVLRFEGADPNAELRGQGPLSGTSNYFLGTDPAGWHAAVPTFAQVMAEGVWPGVDVVYATDPNGLRYDLVLSPAANAHNVSLRFEGALGLEQAADGSLVAHMPWADLRQPAPVAYQEIGGDRLPVDARYAVDGLRVRLALGPHDRTRPLVIDPTVSYGTYLGGTSYEEALAVAVDAKGNTYVTGDTYSSNFPVTPGVYQPTYKGGVDVFVTKFDPTGATALYSTYVGGSDYEQGYAIAVDGGGDAYVTGYTSSNNFPVTPGAYQRKVRWQDAFVTKLNPMGSALMYSTRLGGADSKLFDLGSQDYGEGIAVDAAGDAYVTGDTTTRRFPVTPGALQTTKKGYYDGFVSKLNPTGSALVFSTYLGGSADEYGLGMALDGAGTVYLTGETTSSDFPVTPGAYQPNLDGFSDAYVAKLDPSGSSLAYATYLGGSGPEGQVNAGATIAIDGAGHAFVAGTTQSSDFPTTPGAFQTTFGGGGYDAYVTEFDPTGSSLLYSSYLGGSGEEEGIHVSLDSGGRANVVGYTASRNFPLANPIQPSYGGGAFDAFVTEVSADGSSLVWSTYLGGRGEDEAWGVAVGSGFTYVAGYTDSSNFPTTPGVFQPTLAGDDDGFVVKIAS